MALSAWNCNDFVSDQMLGKIQLSEQRQTTKKDIAELTNAEVIRSKKETEEKLWRTYLTTKDPSEQRRLKADIKELKVLMVKQLALVEKITAKVGAHILGEST